MMTAEDTGGLSGGERMGRIESTLLRIERKLDEKADNDAMRTLEHRIQAVEAGDTPLARIMLKQFEAQTETLSNLLEHGSPDAQEALRRVAQAEAEIENLKSADLSRRAADKQTAASREKHYKWLTFTVSVAIVVLMAITIILSTRTQSTHIIRIAPQIQRR